MYMKKGNLVKDCLFQTWVVPAGFEPEQTVPKTVVLPLHHRTKHPVWECKFTLAFLIHKTFLKKLLKTTVYGHFECFKIFI